MGPLQPGGGLPSSSGRRQDGRLYTAPLAPAVTWPRQHHCRMYCPMPPCAMSGGACSIHIAKTDSSPFKCAYEGLSEDPIDHFASTSPSSSLTKGLADGHTIWKLASFHSTAAFSCWADRACAHEFLAVLQPWRDHVCIRACTIVRQQHRHAHMSLPLEEVVTCCYIGYRHVQTIRAQ